MAPQRINNIMHWVQTIMLALITTLIIWVGSEINTFGKFKARQEQINAENERDILLNTNENKAQKEDIKEVSKWKSYVEGAMPALRIQHTGPY